MFKGVKFYESFILGAVAGASLGEYQRRKNEKQKDIDTYDGYLNYHKQRLIDNISKINRSLHDLKIEYNKYLKDCKKNDSCNESIIHYYKNVIDIYTKDSEESITELNYLDDIDRKNIRESVSGVVGGLAVRGAVGMVGGYLASKLINKYSYDLGKRNNRDFLIHDMIKIERNRARCTNIKRQLESEQVKDEPDLYDIERYKKGLRQCKQELEKLEKFVENNELTKSINLESFFNIKSNRDKILEEIDELENSIANSKKYINNIKNQLNYMKKKGFEGDDDYLFTYLDSKRDYDNDVRLAKKNIEKKQKKIAKLKEQIQYV